MTDELIGKILQEGRITIPKVFMKELKLKEGDFVLFQISNNGFEVLPAKVIPR